MSRTCTVCQSPHRAAIERLLVGGTASYRNIAKQFSLSTAAVFRHRTTCLPATLVKAAGEEQVRQALDVIQQLKFANGASLRVLQDARDAGDGDLVLRAVDRVMRQIETQAKLLGQLADQPQINILVSPESIQVRGEILRALEPYPAAAVAVAEALQC